MSDGDADGVSQVCPPFPCYLNLMLMCLQILQILFESNNEVPKYNRDDWCDSILSISKLLDPSDVDCLKRRCNLSMWSALMFHNIRSTPMQVLDNSRVCKVKISDWDLFPSGMKPSVSLAFFHAVWDHSSCPR